MNSLIKPKLTSHHPFSQIFFGWTNFSWGNLRLTKTPTKEVIARRKNLIYAIPTEVNLKSGLLQHGKQIRLVYPKSKSVITGDGLFTNSPQVALSVTMADCLAIFMYCPQTRVVGLLHAGWRGLVAGILPHAVRLAQKEFKVKPSNWWLYFSPAICMKHYPVARDLAEKFKVYPRALKKNRGSWYLSLQNVAIAMAVDSGIKIEKIQISPVCTFENNEYFSYRRENSPKKIRAQAAVISLAC